MVGIDAGDSELLLRLGRARPAAHCKTADVQGSGQGTGEVGLGEDLQDGVGQTPSGE